MVAIIAIFGIGIIEIIIGGLCELAGNKTGAMITRNVAFLFAVIIFLMLFKDLTGSLYGFAIGAENVNSESFFGKLESLYGDKILETFGGK